MSPEEREAFYDKEIAPELLRLSRACEEWGLPFLAAVGYDGVNVGRTVNLPPGATLFFRTLYAAMQCWEDNGGFNIDKLCFALARAVRGKPHSSMVLKLMGVPPEGES